MKGKWLAMLLIAAGSVACNKGAAQSKETAAAIAPVAEVTIVGCVKPADPAATNATEADATKYMLTDASAKNGTASGTTGGSAASPPSASTYRLDASDSMLDPEAGHQVEIMAVVADPDDRPTGTTGTSGNKTLAPKVKVHAIRMITALCPD